MITKKALFLDRDGVINEDLGYVSKIDDFRFCDGLFAALREFARAGYLLVVVTNQSGIGRGYYSEADFLKLSQYMLDELKKQEIKIEKIYHCPHAPEQNCPCRKPAPGMILRAASELCLDLKSSILIGDKQSDIQAAKQAGVGRAYLLGDKLKGVLDVLKVLKKEKIL